MSELSAATIAAFAAGGAILIGAIFTGIVQVIGALHTISSKMEAVGKDTAVVLGHVNSEKSISEGRENTLKAENDLLREMIADKKSTAELLAQSESHPPAVIMVPPTATASPVVAPTSIAEVSLSKIDANTAAIEQNTAKTDQTVTELKAQG